jgi:putative ABC transport system permease protein
MTGWRALLRVASRDARRHRGRAVLVATMIAVPVTLMAAALTIMRTAALTAEQDAADEMGQADIQLYAGAVPSSDWQALMPPGSRWVAVRGGGQTSLLNEGELLRADVIETDLANAILRGSYDLVRGRAARSPQEVVISREIAQNLGVDVGDRIRLRSPDRAVRVTGVAIAPTALDRLFVVVAPGWLDDTANANYFALPLWWVDVPDGTAAVAATKLERDFASFGLAVGDHVTTRAELLARRTPTVGKRAAELSLTYLAGALFLIWTGAVAASAFAVSARRRLREVGLVAATGGTPRQLKTLLLADGVVLGLAGTISGVLVGVGAAAVVSHHLDRFTNHVNGPLRVPAVGIMGAAAVGLLAALLAAMAPAVSAARVPVLSALAGLRPPRPHTRSWLSVGAVAVGAGVALCLQGGGSGNENVATAGVLLVVGGVAAATGGLLGLVARVSSRLPVSMRLAARDAGRSRSRSGPAVAAAMLGLGATVAAATVGLSAEAKDKHGYEPYLSRDQLLVHPLSGAATEVSTADVVAVRRAVTRTIPGAVAGTVSPASLGSDPPDLRRVSVAGTQDGTLYVADEAALDALAAGRARAAFRAGTIVALGRGTTVEGKLRLNVGEGPDQTLWQELDALELDVRAGRGAPRYLVSEEAAQRLGLGSSSPGLIVRAPHAVTERDERRVQAATLSSASADLDGVSVDREQGACCDRAVSVGIAFGAGTAVALFVVGLVTALARSELRPYLSTLDAVGAAPRTRRRVAAAQSGVLAALAGLLAVPAGLIPAIALLRTQEGPPVDYVTDSLQVGARLPHPIVLPWAVLAAVVIGVPLLAAAGGALFSRGDAT